MSIEIRPAVKNDQPTIRHIVRQARINPLGLNWPNFVVAEVDGEISGVGQVKEHRDGCRELASIAVRPAYRNQGIASQLVNRLLAQESGRLYLVCRIELEDFYRQFGFLRSPGETLPRSMQRIWRLGRWSSAIMSRLGAQNFTLVIMRWDPGYDRSRSGEAHSVRDNL